MIEASFEYSYEYIKELNTSTMKKYNWIGNISLFILLCGVGVMFAVARNILLGVLASITFVVLLVSFVSVNKSVERSNRGLLGQKVKLNFGEDEMNMVGYLGDKMLYDVKITYSTIKKVDVKDNLIYIKLDKDFIVIIPKSAFKTEDDFSKVLQYVSNNYVI